ncbi:hypothetical protein [Phytohabitans aurantiacus]|uniref:Secreted protein n=1 Tax=Phytohabitans aurantiacus TaxID=3016789 RepID=A0ABQ5R976_9ACTN|nr:hypothetical protein [Phytohabitans aurantiacus]GLI02935.1 hypothetical protein Pa4123_82130 [Phytohabitans aurantiacus]
MAKRRLVVVVFVAAAVIAVPLAILARTAANYKPPESVDPPTLADWMQAWGTVAAVVAGLLAAVFTAGLLIHEMREADRARRDASRERADAERDRRVAQYDRDLARKERHDTEKAQARAVIVDNTEISADNGEIRRVRGRVHNFSSGPILSLEVRLVGTGMLRDLDVPMGVVGTLEPAGERSLDTAVTTAAPTRGLDDHAVKDLVTVEIRFMDSDGRRWIRRGNGQPERVREL